MARACLLTARLGDILDLDSDAEAVDVFLPRLLFDLTQELLHREMKLALEQERPSQSKMKTTQCRGKDPPADPGCHARSLPA